jgi:cell division transport system permease protein
MHAFYVREAWRSIQHHRGLVTTAVIALTAALTFPGVFLLLAHNVEHTMQMVSDRREMVVYLRDDVDVEDRDALVRRLSQLYGDVTYVSKDEAWKEFTEQVGDPSLIEAVEGNPLPASLRVKLRPELLNYASMDSAARQVGGFPEVEDVRYGGEWVRRLDEIGVGLRRAAMIAGTIVALAIIVALYNTLRLTVLARRREVEIMSRLGASDRFIATPFVIEALLEAGVAAVLALVVVFALHRAFESQVTQLVFLPLPWMAAFLGAALLLSWVAALFALSRVLRAVGP